MSGTDLTVKKEVEAVLRVRRKDLSDSMDFILTSTGMLELAPRYEEILAEFDRVISWYVGDVEVQK
jgi:hypothetical protein